MTLATDPGTAYLRWAREQQPEPPCVRMLSVSGVDLDLDGLRVRANGRTRPITLTEFRLLHLLMIHAGRLLGRRFIIDQVWGSDHVETTNGLDVYIRRLRRKIEPDPRHPLHIRVVRGVGYVFDLLS